jgi:hypothetical protein
MAVKVGSIDDAVWRETGPLPSSGPEPRPRRWRWRILIWLLVVAGLVTVLYPPVASIASRKSFGTFSFWAAPNRVDYCGRRYVIGGTVRGDPASFTSQTRGRGDFWQRVEWTYSGRSLFAAVSTTDTSRESPSAQSSNVCAMDLYTPAGSGRWVVYPLSGGP